MTKYNSNGEIEKFKSRVCIDGSRVKLDISETYEGIASTTCIRLLLCLCARFKLHLVQTDIKNFFLQARLPEDKVYYTEIPNGWEQGKKGENVAKVLAPWYGLPEAAKVAGQQYETVLVKNGMQSNPWMPKVFHMWDGDDFIACATHIDDSPWIATNMDKLKLLLRKIDKEFKLEITWNPTKLLGCDLEYDRSRGILKMHQGSFCRDKFLTGRKFKPVRSPGYIPATIANPEAPSRDERQATKDEIALFQNKIGNLMWTTKTDAGSMFAIQRAATAMLNPQKENWNEIARLENYKATNPEIGLVFRAADPPEVLKPGQNLDCLTMFADADLGGCRQTAKSYSGWCAHLGGSGMFDFKTKKQTCVAQSSCESETNCNKAATCDVICSGVVYRLCPLLFLNQLQCAKIIVQR